MKLRYLNIALISLLGATGGILFLENYQAAPDWPRALERLFFLWLGFAAVVLPFLGDEYSRWAGRRRRRKHHSL
jgi:hypothetical protein